MGTYIVRSEQSRAEYVVQVAGAAAAAGLSLEEVRQEAEQAAAAVGSMGVASRACSTPGEEPARRCDQPISATYKVQKTSSSPLQPFSPHAQ